MRRYLFPLLALVGLATPLALSAQTPQAPQAAPTSNSPVAPTRRLLLLVTLSGTMHAAEVRSSLLGGAPTLPRAVALRGVDLLIQPRNGGVGVSARITQSPLGASDLGGMEAGVVVGGTAFSLEAMYVMRKGYSPVSGLSHDSTHSFVRGGIRMRSLLGNSGFSLGLRGGLFLPKGDFDAPEGVEGWEGETTLGWAWDRYPMSAQVGYRLERFAVGGLEQEVSALILGAGIAIGGRR